MLRVKYFECSLHFTLTLYFGLYKWPFNATVCCFKVVKRLMSNFATYCVLILNYLKIAQFKLRAVELRHWLLFWQSNNCKASAALPLTHCVSTDRCCGHSVMDIFVTDTTSCSSTVTEVEYYGGVFEKSLACFFGTRKVEIWCIGNN